MMLLRGNFVGFDSNCGYLFTINHPIHPITNHSIICQDDLGKATPSATPKAANATTPYPEPDPRPLPAHEAVTTDSQRSLQHWARLLGRLSSQLHAAGINLRCGGGVGGLRARMWCEEVGWLGVRMW